MTRELIEYPIVDGPENLAEFLGHLEHANVFALDTEFVRERTYYPKLCVLQIATGEVIAAIDCLASIDLDPLFDVLFSPDKIWVLHSARQDLEVLFFRNRKLPRRLIDTQIAAALTGFPAQIGLQALLVELLGIEIGKQHTRADWSRRPLSDALKRYALDDVRYLLPAWAQLRNRLESLGRAAWFEEDCQTQLAIPIEPDTPTLLDKVRGAGSLEGPNRAAAQALVAWREHRAKSVNRPRRWILGDDQLVRIAARLPQSADELTDRCGLPPRLAARAGDQILSAIDAAEPAVEPPKRPPPERSLVKKLQTEIRARAEALGIQPELLATKRDIVRAAAGQPPDALTSGWRGSVLGEILDAVSRDRAP